MIDTRDGKGLAGPGRAPDGRAIIAMLLVAASAAMLEAAPKTGGGLQADPPIPWSRDYAVGVALAKRQGLPILAVFGDGRLPDTVAALPGLRERMRRVIPVAMLPISPAAKKLEVAGPAIWVADPEGAPQTKLPPDAGADVVVKAIDAAIAAAADAASKRAADTAAGEAVRRAAVETLGKLGTGAGALVPLLTDKSAGLRAAAATALTGLGTAAGEALLDGLASEDAEFRAAVHPLAAKVTRYAKAGTATFWKTGPAEVRATTLADWRRHWGEVLLCSRVVDFCRSRFGTQVGSGQCAALADEALKAVGAAPGNFRDPRNYVWGRLLADDEEVVPGDILQMEECEFRTKAGLNFAPHHTAVVVKVVGPKSYEVLHSNYGGVLTVGPGAFDLKTRTKGTVKIWRPIPPGAAR